LNADVQENETDFDDFTKKSDDFEDSTNDEFAAHAKAFKSAQAADHKWAAKAEVDFKSFHADYITSVTDATTHYH